MELSPVPSITLYFDVEEMKGGRTCQLNLIFGCRYETANYWLNKWWSWSSTLLIDKKRPKSFSNGAFIYSSVRRIDGVEWKLNLWMKGWLCYLVRDRQRRLLRRCLYRQCEILTKGVWFVRVGEKRTRFCFRNRTSWESCFWLLLVEMKKFILIFITSVLFLNEKYK